MLAQITVMFTGRFAKTGEVFDSNENKKPFTFRLGALVCDEFQTHVIFLHVSCVAD